MNRQKYLEKAKLQAQTLLDQGEPALAVGSILLSMKKRSEFKTANWPILASIGLTSIERGTKAVSEFINSFS